MIKVRSNNGTIHGATLDTRRMGIHGKLKRLKDKIFRPKAYDRYVRKMCDGQWVKERNRLTGTGEVNCDACIRRLAHG